MDLIKKEIGADNIKSALSLLVDHLSLDENSYRKEIESLTNEVYVLKNKVKTLEKINSSLLKDRNYNLVKEYSLTLIDLIDSNKLKEVKEIIEKHEFPINEYLTLAENYSHLTLLHIAVENDLNDFVRYLVEKGADVNIPDKIDLWTPLMFAVQKQNIDLVKYLIKRGSDINIKDIDGFTPLAVAVDTRNKDIIRIILKHKPNIEKPDDIVGIAEAYEDQEIFDILKNYFGNKIHIKNNSES